jgi:uncharacterized protein (TIGR03086 family)
VRGDFAGGDLAVAHQTKDGASRRVGNRPQRLVHCVTSLHSTPPSGNVSNILHRSGGAVDLLEALDRTFQHTHDVIAAVPSAKHDAATPCEEWKVRDLLEHMIGVVAGLGAAASGVAPGAFELSDDPATQFEGVAKATLGAWRAPGALERIIEGPAGAMPGQVYAGINLLDTATHSWDLATACGLPSALGDDVAEFTLDVARQTIAPQIRPGRFADEVPAPAGADATARLVAFLGRNP